ncbi:(Fe-S)-binding protein [Dokdonella sp.]|uniref:(Fe-S)-binding protein n=1 Tax=Dokdonella sp. TaxID=2291710 RepID=UPI003C445ACA
MADTTHGTTGSSIEALADQCVMCGLCLPHCPTYHLDQHEAESPRGRIALARQLASGQLPASEASMAHLDRCLGCLSCQSVCPSQVRYDDILIQTRALLAPLRRGPGSGPRWLGRPGILGRLGVVSAALSAHRWLPGLSRLLPAGSTLRRLAAETPMAPSPLQRAAAPRKHDAERAPVALFPGCVARTFDRDTLAAARVLLEALGHEVVMPKDAVCCGALALHAGDTEAALATAQSTTRAMQACGAPTVLVSASGCLGSLRDHGLRDSGMEIADMLGFLASHAAIDTLSFRALPGRAAVHLPCTQLSVGSGAGPIRALLSRVPGLEVLELPRQPGCCGAAGRYFIDQPDHADRLRSEKIGQIAAQAPDWVLTSNIGCRIFLGNGLRQDGSKVPILHPLTLLAQQLEIDRP